MQKIKVLAPHEAIKIAAGEVVERPANILKELLENSIDAQATEIIINTKQSGKKLLSITDNGYGMSPEDAQLCFAHHATSKITTVNDLDTVVTYGFRGEALSSIVAVAQVTITTKTSDAKSATNIVLEHGSIQDQTITAHPTGTTIKVENLFDNIPARKKFLKSHETEWNAITSIFQAFCLRYPNIHFKLLHEDKLSYNCPPTNDIVQRCAQLWSNNLHDQLITVETAEKNEITVSGAISKAHYHRYNRNQIFIFVNNRWVKNIELSRAIIKGYQNSLPPQKYPAAFIFINLDSKLVDINIHPKKEEVKFLHPGIVQKTIQAVVTETLSKAAKEKIEQLTTNHTPETNNQQPLTMPHQQAVSNLFTEKPAPSHSTTKPTDFEQNIASQIEQDPFEQTHAETKTVQEQSSTKASFAQISSQINSFQNQSNTQQKKQIEDNNQEIYDQEELFNIIGQFATTYILIEKNNELLVIDQHAAHERILYESYKKNFTEATTVQLLFPHIIKLNKYDIELLEKHLPIFKQHGIVCETFSETEIIIQATPVSLQHKALDEIFHQTLEWIKEHDFVDGQEFFKELNEQLLAQKACKTACKAGDKLNHEQMTNIVKTLLTIENRFCCPHGRPTMWNMTLKELEKHFHRDYRSKSRSLSNI